MAEEQTLPAPKTYTPKKDPFVKAGYSCMKYEGDDIHRRTIADNSPEVRYFITNSLITNGLGFLNKGDRFGGEIPHYEDTQEGLIRHLAEMDKRVVKLNRAIQTIETANYLSSLCSCENAALRNAQDLNAFQEALEKKLQDIGDSLNQMINENRQMRKKLTPQSNRAIEGRSKMLVEVIENKPKTEQAVALNQLLSIEGFSNTFVSNHYTNEKKISQQSDYPEYDGKNIYASFSFSNPQEFYRELSNNGFTLIDSKISR